MRRLLAVLAALAVALVLVGGVALAQTPEDTGGAAVVENGTGLPPADVSRERGVDEDSRGNPYAAGELLVTYEERVSVQGANAVNQEAGADVEDRLSEIDAAAISFPEVAQIQDENAREEALAAKKRELAADPAVESVSYNYLLQIQTADPLYDLQWHLPRIQAPQAWTTTVGAGARIAIVDNGVENDHPDLTGAVAFEHDYVEGDAVAQPSNTGDGNTSSHGTHVAGIAGARANNNAAGAGVAPGSQLMDYKVVGPAGATIANVAQAIIDAANAGAGVINTSLGGPAGAPPLENAVNYAWNRGSVLTASAGNSFEAGNPPNFPSGYANVISVGATTRANTHSNFSRVGPDVDVVAPGGSTAPGSADADDILSTVPYYFWPFTGCHTEPDCSGYQAGTSQAAPQVAGIAAMLDSRGLSNARIRARIQSTATNLGPAGRDNTFGHGLVNARAALAPTGSVRINGGAAATRTLAVRLSLNATDLSGASVAQMCVSNTTRCTAWRAYTTSLSWRLSAGGAGTRSVYVRFKDRAGVTSAAYRDTIRYAP